VEAPDESFYAEVKPFAPKCDQEAISISGLTLEELRLRGEDATAAMARFEAWILTRAVKARPVFVGFNAPFDWSFVNWYFHRFLGRNPFGFTALDIKAFYMGLSGCDWSETSSSKLPAIFKPADHLEHNSLSDAQAQAGVFAKMLAYRRQAGGADFAPGLI
jgi:DNA polymerase III epsilon subunit-like protein